LAFTFYLLFFFFLFFLLFFSSLATSKNCSYSQAPPPMSQVLPLKNWPAENGGALEGGSLHKHRNENNEPEKKLAPEKNYRGQLDGLRHQHPNCRTSQTSNLENRIDGQRPFRIHDNTLTSTTISLPHNAAMLSRHALFRTVRAVAPQRSLVRTYAAAAAATENVKPPVAVFGLDGTYATALVRLPSSLSSSPIGVAPCSIGCYDGDYLLFWSSDGVNWTVSME
jgi:hypothetical protein